MGLAEEQKQSSIDRIKQMDTKKRDRFAIILTEYFHERLELTVGMLVNLIEFAESDNDIYKES